MVHCGGYGCDLDEVKKVETPKETDSWKPIPHDLLWDLTEKEFGRLGITVKDAAHSLARGGKHYFGLFEVEMPMALGAETDIHNLIIGLRNSHGKDFPAGFVAGSRVFVCDNLCFSGEVKLGRKHTKNTLRDLPTMITLGLKAMGGLRDSQEQRLEAYRDHVLTTDQTRLLGLDMAEEKSGICTWNQAKVFMRELKKPSYEEHLNGDGEPTVWTVQQAATEALKIGPNVHTTLRRSHSLFGFLDNVAGSPNWRRPSKPRESNSTSASNYHARPPRKLGGFFVAINMPAEVTKFVSGPALQESCQPISRYSIRGYKRSSRLLRHPRIDPNKLFFLISSLAT
jgi:hypothetical protein